MGAYSGYMRIHRLACVLLLPLLLLLAACGGDSDDNILESGPDVAPTTASNPSTGGSSSGGVRPTASAQPGPVDVCALFTEADARAVQQAVQPTGRLDSFTATKQAVTSATGGVLGDCKFQWNGAPAGTLSIQARTTGEMSLLKSLGKPVPGLGDEAYSYTGATNVRVGNVMLAAGENTFTESFVVEVYKRMIPKMK